MAGLVDGRLDVPEHDRRRRPQADGVRGAHDLEPLLGAQLVGAEDAPHLVVEDLRGGARQAAEAGVAQQLEVVAQRPALGRGALPDLERGEGVDVQLRQRRADRPHEVEVPGAGEARVDAALQADLRRAAIPRLLAAADDLVDAEQVGRAAQVGRQPALRERAEAAAEVADVGVVDVPADDVGDGVARALGAPRVGRLREQLHLGSACGEQRLGAGLVEVVAPLAAAERVAERRRHRAGEARAAAAAPGGRRLGARAGEPGALVAREAVGVGGGAARRRARPWRASGRRRAGSAGRCRGAA